jgi:hypothetical protein
MALAMRAMKMINTNPKIRQLAEESTNTCKWEHPALPCLRVPVCVYAQADAQAGARRLRCDQARV